MKLPRVLASLYAQAATDPSANQALLAELDQIAEALVRRGPGIPVIEVVTLSLVAAPPNCQLCGKKIQKPAAGGSTAHGG